MYIGAVAESVVDTATESGELVAAPGNDRQYVLVSIMLQCMGFSSAGTIQLKGGTDLLAHVYVTEAGMGVVEDRMKYVIPCGENKAINLVVPEGVDEVAYAVRYIEVSYPLQ